MSDDIAISVENVSKAYRIWNDPSARIKSPFIDGISRFVPSGSGARDRLAAKASGYYRDFYALSDISFQVRKGESVGIIGRNGSGKTTLLQIIAGTLQPTEGTVTVNGRVAALLELGSGFNPDFTGRENIRLNAVVLGLSPSVIDDRMGSIIAYADVGEFIDQPVKTYSSGMHVRLAFAVAAHVDAEILIIDEALGVGDARFQLKCAKTIDGFIESGKTLLFVSHDVSSVKRLCQRALLLERGHCLLDGNPNTVVNFYSKLAAEPKPLDRLKAEANEMKIQLASGITLPCTPAQPQAVSVALAPSVADAVVVAELRRELARAQTALASLATLNSAARRIDLVLNADALEPTGARGHEFSYGGQLGRIEEVEVRTGAGLPSLVFISGDLMVVTITVRAVEDVPTPLYALTVKSANGQDVYVTNTLFRNVPTPAIAAGERARITFTLQLNLMAGEYFISLGWVTFIGDELLVIQRRYDVLKFQVLPVDRRAGIANLHSNIEITQLP